jgi:hypothetical protein
MPLWCKIYLIKKNKKMGANKVPQL